MEKDKSLLYNLQKYGKSDFACFHMPGHKRNVEVLGSDLPYEIDITEIDGFDNLYHANGYIKDIQDYAQKIYGAKKSFILVNGSTCGILASIRALTQEGDHVLIARNSHKSVYNAIELCKLKATHLYPEMNSDFIYQSVTAKQVEEKFRENPNIKLVVITSPTYEGVISNINEIAKVVHSHNAILFVDEAHGAHLYFDNRFSGGAVQNGADVVVNSLHKTLPALTQCALLNVCSDSVDADEILRQLAVFQTSSPSYVLMSSIEKCLHFTFDNKKKLFEDYYQNLSDFNQKAKKLKNLKILCYGKDKKHKLIYGFDFGKLTIITTQTNITGVELASILRQKYQIEVEMAYISYVVAMTSICDKKQNFERLINALLEIDKTLKKQKQKQTSFCLQPKKQLESYENIKDLERTKLENALNKVSGEYIWVYPPGVPLVVKGEIIDENVINALCEIQKTGLEIKSSFSLLPEQLYVKTLDNFQ